VKLKICEGGIKKLQKYEDAGGGLLKNYKNMEMRGINPRTSRMLSEELHPQDVLTEICRNGFTTLPLVPLLEQYRCGSFVGGAQVARGVGYQGTQWTRRFTWFGPPERNTLRPRVKGVVLLCLSARLRSSLFSPPVCACVWSCLCLSSTRTFYSPRPGSYSETPRPDRWPRGL
jgi:hypothetical protein